MAERGGSGRRQTAGEVRLSDAVIDGVLDAWPDEPPRPPRTPVDRVRLTLIDTPGVVHRLGWKFSDVGRAAKLASAFRRAKPSKLSPTATGVFDARAFYDPADRQWRIAARYTPNPANHTTNSNRNRDNAGDGEMP